MSANRQISTKQQVREAIQKSVSESKDLDGDCRDVIVNEVYWHEPDETGCNWNLHSIRGDASCMGVVSRIVDDQRSKYNIPDESEQSSNG